MDLLADDSFFPMSLLLTMHTNPQIHASEVLNFSSLAFYVVDKYTKGNISIYVIFLEIN